MIQLVKDCVHRAGRDGTKDVNKLMVVELDVAVSKDKTRGKHHGKHGGKYPPTPPHSYFFFYSIHGNIIFFLYFFSDLGFCVPKTKNGQGMRNLFFDKKKAGHVPPMFSRGVFSVHENLS
jgi:hypothetical protein